MLGVIDAQARLYHAETKQWVPVTRHRELGRALLGGAEFPPDSLLEFAALTPEELAEVEEVAATTFSTRKRTPEPPPPAPPPKPRDAFYEEPPPPVDLEGAIVLDDSAPAEYTSLDWRPERRMGPRVLAGAAVVLALFIVAGWFAWRWWTTPPAIETATEPVAATPTSGNTGTPTPTPALSDSAIAAGLAAAESLANENKPRATPRARSGAITAATPRAVVVSSSPTELQMSYAASYSDVRAAMDSALDIAGVRRLFTLARLASPDSLRSARRALTAARNIFRSYRGDEVQVERAFRDTVEYLVREAGWGPSQKRAWEARTSFKDSYEGAQLTDSLLTSVDRIYTLLLAEWGTWTREGAAIRFNDPSAAQEYGRETAWLDNRLDRLAATTSPVATVRRMQLAIGDTRPPLLAPR